MPPLLRYNPSQPRSLAAPVAPAPTLGAQPVVHEAAQIAQGINDFMRQAGPLLGQAYQREQVARMDEQVLAASEKFARWEAAYQQERQGRGALTAAEDYAQAWADISRGAVEEFASPAHEIFGDVLGRRLAEKGEGALRRGIAYAARQRELWQQSQWQSQQDDFYRSVESDPGDVAGIVQEREALKGALAAREPGRDHRAVFNAIDERTVSHAVEAALARGDTAMARQLLVSPLARRARGARLGDTIAPEESGDQGVACVNYLPTDGTAYGTWQLSSKQGSYQEWLRFMGSGEARAR